MKWNLSVRNKIQIYILGSVIAVYLVVFGYISFSNRKEAYRQTVDLVLSHADKYAGEIGAQLNSDMATLRTLASASEVDQEFPIGQFLGLKNRIIRRTFIANPSIYSIWDSWEYSYIKPGWDKPYGREAFTIWREDGTIKETITERSLTGDPEAYGGQKVILKENAFEPYLDLFAQGKAEAQMMTSLSIPMFRNGKFIGIMAEDVTLNQFQLLLEKIKPFQDANAMLISQKGVVAGYPNKKMLNKKVTNIVGSNNQSDWLIDSIKRGARFSFVAKDSLGVEQLYAFAPIHIGRDKATTWGLGISVPVSTIYAQADRSFAISLMVGLVGLLIIWLVTYVISRNIIGPITLITDLLRRISRGEANERMHASIQSQDELGQMGNALNSTLDNLIHKADFADQIGKGELDTQLELMSEDDNLGKSLIKMRDNLKAARKEEEARKQLDEQQRWGANTVARINDIIRMNSHDLKTLCQSLIRELVLSVNANQGGVFLINEQEQMDVTYDLVAAFAYNRQKLLKRSFRIGEGVIGACIAEKEQIYMTEVPDEFVEITSGLGGANPRNILVVPFIHDGKVLGVFEMASFTILEAYQQEIVQRVAESFASAISFAQNGATTQYLLEQSKMHAEMMAAQEEEMRQNLEELRSTQEESLRLQSQASSLIDAIGSAIYWIEYDLNGEVVSASPKMAALYTAMGQSYLEKTAMQEFVAAGKSTDEFKIFWERVTHGATQKSVTPMSLGAETRTMVNLFSPIRGENQTVRVVKVAFDITEYLN